MFFRASGLLPKWPPPLFASNRRRRRALWGRFLVPFSRIPCLRVVCSVLNMLGNDNRYGVFSSALWALALPVSSRRCSYCSTLYDTKLSSSSCAGVWPWAWSTVLPFSTSCVCATHVIAPVSATGGDNSLFISRRLRQQVINAMDSTHGAKRKPRDGARCISLKHICRAVCPKSMSGASVFAQIVIKLPNTRSRIFALFDRECVRAVA